jgi:hypothetical protein
VATSLTLQNSINFVTPILKNQPLLISNMEPAVSAANLVLGTILSPPFRWRFNRNQFSFPITQGAGTDYVRFIPNLGFIEVQWLIDANNKIHQLAGEVALAKATDRGRPMQMAPQYDDNSGNITFRFDRVPDQAYTAFGDFQKKAGIITSAGSPWGVVPDEFQHVYHHGFLSLMSLLVNDSRFPIFENYFVSRLLSAQDGLSDQARDIFLANWTRVIQTLTRTQGSVQTATAGRAKL